MPVMQSQNNVSRPLVTPPSSTGSASSIVPTPISDPSIATRMNALLSSPLVAAAPTAKISLPVTPVIMSPSVVIPKVSRTTTPPLTAPSRSPSSIEVAATWATNSYNTVKEKYTVQLKTPVTFWLNNHPRTKSALNAISVLTGLSTLLIAGNWLRLIYNSRKFLKLSANSTLAEKLEYYEGLKTEIQLSREKAILVPQRGVIESTDNITLLTGSIIPHSIVKEIDQLEAEQSHTDEVLERHFEARKKEIQALRDEKSGSSSSTAEIAEQQFIIDRADEAIKNTAKDIRTMRDTLHTLSDDELELEYSPLIKTATGSASTPTFSEGGAAASLSTLSTTTTMREQKEKAEESSLLSPSSMNSSESFSSSSTRASESEIGTAYKKSFLELQIKNKNAELKFQKKQKMEAETRLADLKVLPNERKIGTKEEYIQRKKDKVVSKKLAIVEKIIEIEKSRKKQGNGRYLKPAFAGVLMQFVKLLRKLPFGTMSYKDKKGNVKFSFSLFNRVQKIEEAEPSLSKTYATVPRAIVGDIEKAMNAHPWHVNKPKPLTLSTLSPLRRPAMGDTPSSSQSKTKLR